MRQELQGIMGTENRKWFGALIKRPLWNEDLFHAEPGASAWFVC